MKTQFDIQYSNVDQGKKLVRININDMANRLPIGYVTITLNSPYHELDTKIINLIKLLK